MTKHLNKNSLKYNKFNFNHKECIYCDYADTFKNTYQDNNVHYNN